MYRFSATPVGKSSTHTVLGHQSSLCFVVTSGDEPLFANRVGKSSTHTDLGRYSVVVTNGEEPLFATMGKEVAATPPTDEFDRVKLVVAPTRTWDGYTPGERSPGGEEPLFTYEGKRGRGHAADGRV